ncbi:MAG: UDP-N-acetylmuramate dehydrogenase [Lutimonas sp.]
MMFQENISLRPYNTFGIEARAKQFVNIDQVEELRSIIETSKDIFVLSGGSNILLTRDIEKPVVHIRLKGIEVISDQGEDRVLVQAQAGENWHELVTWCIERDLGGLENLSLIPGQVGTSPMQNIGAYGVEIKDVFHELEAMEIESGKIITFTGEDCHFGYRESVFKNELKGKFIILNVTFSLSKRNHKLVTGYGAIQSELSKRGIEDPGIEDISRVVIDIRQSKLPDPEKLGNSGSFFKNPIITTEQLEGLREKYPEMPFYPIDDQSVKVPAGWLVEQSGFKGKRFGDAGVHAKQALVLVNHGDATGTEILNLSKKIQAEVLSRFGIELHAEVNII